MEVIILKEDDILVVMSPADFKNNQVFLTRVNFGGRERLALNSVVACFEKATTFKNFKEQLNAEKIKREKIEAEKLKAEKAKKKTEN